jgi:hypothetical protein
MNVGAATPSVRNIVSRSLYYTSDQGIVVIYKRSTFTSLNYPAVFQAYQGISSKTRNFHPGYLISLVERLRRSAMAMVWQGRATAKIFCIPS